MAAWEPYSEPGSSGGSSSLPAQLQQIQINALVQAALEGPVNPGLFVASPPAVIGTPSLRAIARSDLPLPYVNTRAPMTIDDTNNAYNVGDFWNGPGGLFQALRVAPSGKAVWQPTRPGSSPLPLDAVPTALAAYGMRKLRNAHTAACIDVLRASDSTTISVGFVGNDLDTATLDAFLVGTTGVVTKWYDQSGNANHATAVTASAPAVNSALMIGNARSLIFNSVWQGSATSNNRFMTIPATVTAAVNASSSIMVARARDTYREMSLLQLTSSAANSIAFGRAQYSQYAFGLQVSGGAFYGNAFASQTPFVCGYSYGTSAEVWIDSQLFTQSGVSNSSALAGGFIGTAPFESTFTGYCELAEMIIYGRAITDTERQTATAAAYQAFNIIPQSRSLWFIDGDSITDGYGSTYHQNYPRLAEPLLKKPVIVRNNGVYGDTMANRLAQITSTLTNGTQARSYIINGADNVISIFAGTNDIQLQNTSAASLLLMLQQYCAAGRVLGYKVIVATMLPRTTFSTAQDLVRQAFNALVTSSWWLFADGLADVNADPTMGGAQSVASNTALYVDGTHPSTLGYTYLAPIFADAVNRLLV